MDRPYQIVVSINIILEVVLYHCVLSCVLEIS